MNQAAAVVMPVTVKSTDGRGLTPEEIAELCLEKILHVSESAPPVIRDQAQAFKDQIRGVLIHYMRQAAASDRTTVYNMLADAGQPELAESIRRH